MFVASTHSSPHHLFELCEDLLLDLELLEHRLEHEVAVGEAVVVGAAGDERREEPSLAFVVAALGDLAVRFPRGCRRAPRRRSPASRRGSRSVPRAGAGTASRSGAPSGLRRRCRPCRPSAARRSVEPDASSPAARRARTHRSTPAPAVRAEARRLPRARGCSPLRPSTSCAPSIRSSAVYGAGAAPWTVSSTLVRARRNSVSASDQSGAGRSSGCVRELARERERLVDELHRLEQPVGDPELRDLRTGEHAVLPQRIRDDHLDRRLRPDEPRQELRAAPRRKEAEEDLRKGEVADCSRDRARRAVQRELDATAETCAVDRRDGRERQCAQAPEQLVSRTRAFDRTRRV